MAYTGTGTQSDPYVVSTYSDLISALQAAETAQAQFWIKIANDINCADDPNYTGNYTSPLYMTAGTMYADSQVCIEGLTITSTSFMISQGNNYGGSVTNIYFKNCVYKATTAGAAFACGSQGYTFNNCKFSMIMTFGSYASYVFSHATASSCSGYFKFINSNKGASFGEVTGSGQNAFTNCNFIIDSLSFNEYAVSERGIWGQGYSMTQGKITSTSIIFKNCSIGTVSSGDSTVYITPEGTSTWIDSSYIAFLDCTFANNITTLYGCNPSSSGTLSIGATDDTNLTLSTGNAQTLLVTTISNLKDKDYLLSVGFLP